MLETLPVQFLLFRGLGALLDVLDGGHDRVLELLLVGVSALQDFGNEGAGLAAEGAQGADGAEADPPFLVVQEPGNRLHALLVVGVEAGEPSGPPAANVVLRARQTRRTMTRRMERCAFIFLRLPFRCSAAWANAHFTSSIIRAEPPECKCQILLRQCV